MGGKKTRKLSLAKKIFNSKKPFQTLPGDRVVKKILALLHDP